MTKCNCLLERDINDSDMCRGEQVLMSNKKVREASGKRYAREVVRQDMTHLYITNDMTLDKKVWRLRIRVEVVEYCCRDVR